jgi:soluble lytic murein transglycosylase-like protein
VTEKGGEPVKLTLNQTCRIAIAFAVVLLGFEWNAASPVRAEQVYYYKGADGVFRFTRERLPGAKPFHVEEDDRPRASRKARSKRVERSTVATPRAVAQPRAVASHAVYDHIIVDYAERYGVDAALVKAIIHAESDFRPKARSRVGARGLMQLMPETARMYGVSGGRLYEPRTNIHAGVRHLRSLLRTFEGNVRLSVAAYNAGEGAVKRHRGLPPYRETRGYVRKVLRFYARYSEEVMVALATASEEGATIQEG